MTCNFCGKQSLLISEFYTPTQCTACRGKYMVAYERKHRVERQKYHREYMRLNRWLDGADRTDDLGEKMNVTTRTAGERLLIYRNRERIA